MSYRTLSIAVMQAVALLAFSTIAPAQTTPTTTASTEPEEQVPNPRYLAWSTHKVGTEVEMEMKTNAAGQVMTTSITQTLAELTPEKAVVRSVYKMNIPGLPSQPQTQEMTFAAKVGKSEAERGNFPAGGEGETQDLGTEKITAGGKTYETKVSEFTGKVQGADAKGKQWIATEVPGGLLKMDSETAGMKVSIEVKKITEGK